MKKILGLTATALLASATLATAGGIDRSGQSVDLIFEPGTFAKMSFGYVDPNVTGLGFGNAAFPTGDMAPAYTMVSGGFKTDFGGKFAAGLVFDQPFGASVSYAPAGIPFGGITATVDSSAITGILSYDVTNSFVVFGGGKAQSASGSVANPLVSNYTLKLGAATGYGYVVGAAFQKPEIALRVALTYQSTVSTTHVATEGSTAFGPGRVSNLTVVTPQSVNLEFQTGVNTKTLVFGSVRWVNWSAFNISPADYGLMAGGPLLSYKNDVITYSLGVGRKLSDTLSAALTVGYEKAQGGASSPMAPTDGSLSVGAGLTYTMGNAKITVGGKYIWLGDTYVALPLAPNSPFTGNTAMAFGMSVSTSF